MIRAGMITLTGILGISSAAVAAPPHADHMQPNQAQTASESAPPPLSCPNARFRKHVALTDALIAQAPSDIQGLSHALSSRLADHLSALMSVEIQRLPPTRSTGMNPAVDSFNQYGSTYFVRIVANNLELTGKTSQFSYWHSSYDPRGAHLSVTVTDGSAAHVLASFTIDAKPVSEGPYDPAINASSVDFWRSSYGESLDNALKTTAERIRTTLGCQPTVGKVTAIDGGRLTIDLGRKDGLQVGDNLMLIKVGQPKVALGSPMPLESANRSIGYVKVESIGQNNARVTWKGSTAIEVGDLVWTGEHSK